MLPHVPPNWGGGSWLEVCPTKRNRIELRKLLLRSEIIGLKEESSTVQSLKEEFTQRIAEAERKAQLACKERDITKKVNALAAVKGAFVLGVSSRRDAFRRSPSAGRACSSPRSAANDGVRFSRGLFYFFLFPFPTCLCRRWKMYGLCSGENALAQAFLWNV